MLDLNSLNEAQRKAVTYGEGPLLVLAGPGSGKTFTITQRIFFLLTVEKIPPQQILVITFTKEAALSMEKRFQSQSGSVYPVNFGTFHSVFYHILREANVLAGNAVLNSGQKKALIVPILQKLKKEQEEAALVSGEEAEKVLSALSFYKNTGDEKAAALRLSASWRPCFAEIVKGYEAARKKVRAADFDDMLYQCLELLRENKELRAYWQKRFSHILIDEFQDINPIQYEVVRLLAGKHKSVFAVGDDDQAIYGFRGSNPACLKKFAEEFSARQLLLNVNYRSCREIVEASCLVIEENKERFLKAPRASCNSAGEVRLSSFETREEQYQALIERLKEADGLQAVLFRTNLLMQSFCVLVKKAGLSYAMKEKPQSIYQHFIVKDILAYMRLAAGEKSRELLLEIINKPCRAISREAFGQEAADLNSILVFYESEAQRGGRTENQAAAVRRLKKQLQYLKEAPPGIGLQYIRRAVGYEKYLVALSAGDGEKLSEWRELLDWLGRDAAGHHSLRDWLEAQRAYEESLHARDKTGRESTKAAIQLMTVHASKGLEFDRVYLPDCNERVFPYGRMPDQEACEEERRIFYVAMTRAKKSLELSFVTGTKERPRLPSRFLNPLLGKYYSSISSSNSQLSRYSSKASATFSYSSSSSIKDSSGSSLESSGFSR